MDRPDLLTVGSDHLSRTERLLIRFVRRTLEPGVVDGTPWYYVSAGLAGELGDVVDLGGGEYALNLGDGAGLTTVPEPATLTLLALGLSALALRRRRR